MANSKGRTMPNFDSLDSLVEFFDSHDLGDYLAEMPEKNFDINIKRRTHVIALDEDLARTLTEIAQAKRLSSRTLVNRWLREKVSEQQGT